MISRLLGLGVVALGSGEVVASVLRIDALTTFGFETQIRVFTAFAFVLSGIMLFLLSVRVGNHWKTMITTLGLGQVTFLLWYYHTIGQVASVDGPLGPPSIGTSLGFLLMGLVGLSKAWNGRYARQRGWLGSAVFCIAVVGLYGYANGEPGLYWQTKQSVAMACPTLLGFLGLGLGTMALHEHPHEDSR